MIASALHLVAGSNRTGPSERRCDHGRAACGFAASQDITVLDRIPRGDRLPYAPFSRDELPAGA